MKAVYGLIGIFSMHFAFEPPPQIMTLPVEVIEQSRVPAIGLNDLNALKTSFEKLTRKKLKSLPSGPIEPPKIARSLSAGTPAKIDCKTLDLQINFACREALKILEPIQGSHSPVAQLVNLELYQQAQKYYRNALSTLIISFNLKCYDAFERINQIFGPFLQIEYNKQSLNKDYTLDQSTQELYTSLKDVLREERKRRKHNVPSPMNIQISKDIDEIRHEKAQKSLENGRAFRDGVRNTRKSIMNPSLEQYEFIELLTYNAFEHFIAAFHCDSDDALGEAHEVLQELKAIHNLKLEQHKMIGTRYPEALQKYNQLMINATEMYLLEEATDNSAPGKKLQESELAVLEKSTSSPRIESVLNAPLPSKTTPLSLLKSAWDHIKDSSKTLWKKLPF